MSSSPDYFAFLEPWFRVSPSTFCLGPWVNSLGHLPTPPAGEMVTTPNSLLAPTIMSLPEKACAPQFRAETTVPSLLPLWVRWSWLSGPSCHEGRSLPSEWPCSQCGSPRSSHGTDSPRPGGPQASSKPKSALREAASHQSLCSHHCQWWSKKSSLSQCRDFPEVSRPTLTNGLLYGSLP